MPTCDTGELSAFTRLTRAVLRPSDFAVLIERKVIFPSLERTFI